jgi:hypothetical protein
LLCWRHHLFDATRPTPPCPPSPQTIRC